MAENRTESCVDAINDARTSVTSPLGVGERKRKPPRGWRLHNSNAQDEEGVFSRFSFVFSLSSLPQEKRYEHHHDGEDKMMRRCTNPPEPRRVFSQTT